ncbi:IS3 family transposase [Paenibacillus sp. PL91]|uniref:IS3 family transposase n=1 Tax=Paenibacillus sp. PL91 TaxID=2729538 RepID=UPI003982EDDD
MEAYIHFYNNERLQAKLNGLSPRPLKCFIIICTVYLTGCSSVLDCRCFIELVSR